MKIRVINDDKSENIYPVDEHFVIDDLKEKLLCIPSQTKEANALEILKAYLSHAKPILYDKDNTSLSHTINTIDKSLFDVSDFALMLFTSGATGEPTGVFKTRENIEADMNALVQLLGDFKPNAIVSTVPFVHIYGFLNGLLLPFKLDIDLIFKEHFLPHDLLEFAKPKHIIITTPLYIKSLIRLDETQNLKETLFISSTGPLDTQSAQTFVQKFNTTLIQLFGSTETGSVAYKKQDDTLWTPLNEVTISTNDEGLLHIQSPFVSHTLWNKTLIHTNGSIQTFDYAHLEEGKFKLMGRSNQIIKVAGKRYATLQIEEFLEKIEGITKALVHVKLKNDALKDEILVVYIETSCDISNKEIHQAIKHSVGKINLPIEIKMVDKISTSLMGKKCMPLK